MTEGAPPTRLEGRSLRPLERVQMSHSGRGWQQLGAGFGRLTTETVSLGCPTGVRH